MEDSVIYRSLFNLIPVSTVGRVPREEREEGTLWGGGWWDLLVASERAGGPHRRRDSGAVGGTSTGTETKRPLRRKRDHSLLMRTEEDTYRLGPGDTRTVVG